MRRTISSTEKPTTSPRRTRRWLRALKIGVVIVLVLMAGLVALPVISPSAGAAVADGLRAILGPEPVAALESASFQLQDAFNRARYQVTGGQPQLTWADPTTTTASAPVASAPLPIAPASRDKSDGAYSPLTSSKTAAQTVAPLPNAVTEPSPMGVAWQAFGPTVNGTPIIARATVNPDPGRPYASVALVRIDLSLTRLSVVPGTVEPIAAKGVPAFPRPGQIPSDVQTSGDLLLAFNGGFKAVHGGYGMMVDGITIRPPLDNMATVAMYQDGRVKIGAWGRDITTTTDLTAYRQNCPLLIDEGQISSSVNNENRKEWGYTVKNLDTTWRSGLGMTRDGRFLIYAVGNSLTVESLAQALQQAGAYYAMQLDINGFYTRFVTYQTSNSKINGISAKASKLLNEMQGNSDQFLQPYDRDFFYVTVRPQA